MSRFIQLIIMVCCCLSTLQAEIINCRQLRELLPLIDKDTLVVFNINNVLTTSKQDAGSTPWAEENIAAIIKSQSVDKPHATNLFIPLWHDVLIASDVELFDPEAEVIVRYLQDSGIKVMALTNRYIEMGYPTHNNLRSVGIDFARNPPYSEDTFIKGGSPAKYIEGIIFNGLINFKGDTLANFLQQINYTPKKLIYIEDKPKHLTQVGEKVAALGIPFLGVHFGALEAQRESYDIELAALQVKFHQDILDDKSAYRILEMYSGKTSEQMMKQNPLPQELPEDIRIVRSVSELKDDLKSGSLFVTELDQVLWNTQGMIGTRDFYDYVIATMDAKAKAERLFEVIQRRAQVYLQEPSIEELLKECQAVAVTYRSDKLMSRTLEQAKNLGISFKNSFEVDQPFLSNQIIFASPVQSQYAALGVCLDKAEMKPKQIVGLSSRLEDLLQLKEVAEQRDIPFYGRLLYVPETLDLHPDVVAIELQHLNMLLTNQEAEALRK